MESIGFVESYQLMFSEWHLKEGSPMRLDSYVHAPGLVESFQTAGLSHEAFLTGQCAAVFVKMMVDDIFAENGVFAPEQLPFDARRYYFEEIAKLGVTVEHNLF